jgi:anti-sigma factor RsiW
VLPNEWYPSIMMPPEPEKLEELLSGMLDGVLSEDEQRQLDAAMKSDPSIAERLEALTNLRRSLLRGRSVGRLGPDFSKRILQAAKERAEALEAPPAWILPDHPNAVPALESDSALGSDFDEVEETSRATVKWKKNSRPVVAQAMISSYETRSATFRERIVKVWGPSLLAVAALGALFLALPKISPVDPNGAPIAVQENPVLADPDPVQTDPALILPSEKLSPSEISSVASSDPANSKENAVVPEKPNSIAGANRSNGSNGSNSALAETKPMVNDPGANQVARGEATGNDGAADAVIEAPKTWFTLIAEIQQDERAVEDDILNGLLERFEIITSKDLNLDKAQTETLIANKVIGGVQATDASDKTTVYFLKAKGMQIDGFLGAVQAQYKDFPKYRLNLSSDPNVRKLVDQLGIVSDSATDNAAMHRLLFGTGDEQSPATQGVASKEQGPVMDVERRKASKGALGGTGFKQAEDMRSYLLLLVRQPEN